MSHIPTQLSNQSPARRGTPSTNEPIPFFGGQREDGSGNADFFSSIGGVQKQNVDPRAHHTAGPTLFQQPQQQQHHQQNWNMSQTIAPYGQPPQQYTYNQNTSQEVPPRCATGPAQEQTYAGYEHALYNANTMTANVDPYRSASVVYGGVQYGAQYGYQPPPVNNSSQSWGAGGADFFDQLTVGNAAPSQQHDNVPDPLYYAQQGDVSRTSNPATGHLEPLANSVGAVTNSAPTTYESDVGVGGDGGNGVIYDAASGQYYDTSSGQYYDSVTGMWYYPNQQAELPVADAQPIASGVVNQSQGVAALPVDGDNVKDGAAFFDSLISTQEQSFEPESQKAAAIPEMAGAEDIAERQVPDTYTALSTASIEQNGVPDTFDMTHSGVAAVSLAPEDIAEPPVIPLADLPRGSTSIMPDGSSLPVLDDLHGLSDTAAVADAAVSAACEIADAANTIGDNTISKNDDNIEATSGWPSVVTDSAPTMQSGQAVATALHSDTSNTIMDASQPVTGGDDVSAFYSKSYSTVNDLASYDDPQTSNGIYAHAFATTVPLSTDGLPVAGDNNLQLRGESLDPSVYPGTDLGQKPFNGHGMEQPIPFDDAHQPLQVSSSQQWDVYAEKTSFGAGVSEQHALDDFAEGVDEAHSSNAQPLATLPISDSESYQLRDNTGYGYTSDAYPPTGTDPAEYAGSTTYQYSHHGDDEIGNMQQQQQQHQYEPHNTDLSNGSYMYSSTQYNIDRSTITPAPLDPYSNSSAAALPPTFSEFLPAQQDVGGVAYSTVSQAATPQYASGFNSGVTSNRPSTEIPYYGREPSVASHATGSHDGISDPLGRLNACYPIVAFGFGGKFASMFPKNVQRLNMYDSGKASRVAPGILSVQKLAKVITDSPETCDPQVFGGAPLLTGETTRPALLKRRDVAVSGGRVWLDAALAANALTQEERALFEVLLAILEAFNDSDSQSLDLSGTLKSLRSLFRDADGSPTDNGSPSSQLLPEISNGSHDQIMGLETLLLSGKREEAIDTACSQGLWVHALIISSCTGKKQWQSVISAYTNGVLKDRFSSLSTQYRLFSGLGAQVFESQGSDRDALADEKNQFIAATDLGQRSTQTSSGVLAKDGSSAHADHASQNVVANDWAKTLSLIIANRTPGDQGAILKLGDCLRDDGRILAAHICYALSLQSKEIFFPDMSQYAHPRAILLGANEFDRDRSARSNTFGLVRTPFSRFYKHTPALIATELYELAYALKTASVSDPHQTGGSSTPSNSRPQSIQGSNGASGTGTMQGSRHAPMFCLPHFQAYKLQHAWWLVDCGQTALASRYCDSILGILATLPQGVAVPYIHSSLVQGLRDLRERLSGTGMTSIKAAEMTGDTAALSGASSKSWLARAMPRPSFSSLMTAFDSSIDKFITGADGSRISLESSGTSGKYEVGPDRHSFDRQSQGSSQQQPPPPAPHSPPRPLGAVSWGGRTPSPRLATTAATAGSTFEQVGFADAYIPSYGSPRQSMDGRPSNSEFGIQDMSVAEPPRMFTPSNIVSSYADGVSMSVPSQQFVEQTAQPPQWGIPESGSGGSIGGHSQFIDPAAVFGAGGNPVGNHISGMTLSMQPAAPGPAAAATAVEDNSGDEEDMFGFSKRPPPSQTPASGSARQSVDISRKSLSSSSAQTPADTKDGKDNAGKKDSETDDKAGSGVIGMLKSLWGGRKNQANLGEESNFVYDPELKRWVDKNAPDSQNDTGPPPPPPPSMMKFQPQSASVPPPSTPVGMASRPGSVLPPHPSTDPSRTGTPVSALGSRTPSIPPPASTGGAKRRSARAKYVNAM